MNDLALFQDFLRWFWSSPYALGTILGVGLISITLTGLLRFFQR